jgi:2-dehydropantoate 2-reductase
MHIAIFGIGAMGCLFGARLSKVADVTLIGTWPAQIRALQNGLLRITELDGRDTFVDLHAVDDVREAEPADVVLVLTKAYKTKGIAVQVAEVLVPGGLVVTLQNGLGSREALTVEVNKNNLTYGVTTQGATVEAAGAIRHGGSGPTHLAARPAVADRVAALAEVFNAAGLPTHTADDLQSLVWGKLAINAGINPVTALLGIPNGRILDSAYATGLMRDAAHEVEQIAAAMEIDLPFASAADEAVAVAEATAENRSSMLQDISRGAPTEVDAICGAVIRAGQAVDVPTPTTIMLYRLLKAVEDLQERA